jgi:O-antigen/teichoic acid export membrane protein
MAIATLTSMTLWADFGLGNGLLTKLAPCYAADDWASAQRLVANAYALLTTIALSALAVLWLISRLLPWSTILHLQDHAIVPTARVIVLVCFTAFLLNIPLSLVQRVQYAYQRVARNNIWQGAGSLLSLVLTLAAVRADLPKTVVIAAAVIGPLLANTLNSLILYTRQLPRLAPNWRLVERRTARSLLGLGGQFFMVSILTAIAPNTDNLIIAHVLGLRYVTDYSVPDRVFSSLGLLVDLINLPLWPTNGEALARGDIDWVRRTTLRMTLLSGVVVTIPGVILVVDGERILHEWVGNSVGVSTWLLVGLAAWWLPLAIMAPMFMVQNASGIIRPQLIGWLLFNLISIPGKWIAAQHGGIAGVACVDAVVYLATVVPWAIVGYRKALAPQRSPRPQDAT